jgi:hypothetical protein
MELTHCLGLPRQENGEDVHIGTMLCRDKPEVHSEGQHGGCIVSERGQERALRNRQGTWAECNHVPEWLLPRPPGVTQDAHRPAPEVETRRSAGPPNNTEDPEGPAQVYIVEIKTIDAIQRPTRTRTQHTDLANMLTAHGHTVTTVPILVGVTGTIYTEHTQALTGLGVTRPGWACCQKLCTMAINHTAS